MLNIFRNDKSKKNQLRQDKNFIKTETDREHEKIAPNVNFINQCMVIAKQIDKKIREMIEDEDV